MRKLIALFVLFGCSSAKILETKEAPAWVSSLPEICEKEFLCGVGSGYSLYEADQAARSEISKIFSTEVSSRMNSSSDESSQNYSKDISSFTSGLVTGSQVTARWRDANDKILYSFVKISRGLLLNEVEQELRPLVEERRLLFNKRARWAYVKALQIEQKINPQLIRYEILKGDSFNLVPSSSVLNREAKRLFQKSVLIKMNWAQQGKATEAFQQTFFSVLQRNGYSLKTSNSGNQVNASLKVSEVKMNVPQFERYKFSLTLVSKEGRLEWESLIAGKNLGSIT